MNDLSEIQYIRKYSRMMVRELGMTSKNEPYEMPLVYRHILIEIATSESLTQNDLAAQLLLDKTTISRHIQALKNKKLIKTLSDNNDLRYKKIILTDLGEKQLNIINSIATNQVQKSLDLLAPHEREIVKNGLYLYAKALKRLRISNEYTIRIIQKKDNIPLRNLIQDILKTYGADKPGFAFVDPELENMFEFYKNKNQNYYVIIRNKDNKLVGGCGFGSLKGGDKNICELRKMYLSSDVRGLGLGSALLSKILDEASKYKYRQCYLETLNNMTDANRIYLKFGFKQLKQPLGNTGHFGCNMWYIKNL